MFPDICFVAFLLIILCFYLLHRNTLAHKIGLETCDKVSTLVREDIEAGRTWRWRIDALERINYIHSVLFIWKPVRSFYTGKFLEKIVEKNS